MVNLSRSHESVLHRRKEHWENVYATKAATHLSWYQADPKLSLELIDGVASTAGGRIVDIGGGASLLVDRLVDLPFKRIAVLDISETALGTAKAWLNERAGRVEWIAADVTLVGDIGIFDVWHDRAVFHFLTDATDRKKYVDLARRTVPVGGHVIVATFAGEGPQKCSGLDVCRYDAGSLCREFGNGFLPVREAVETHLTPSGTSQAFFYGVFSRQ